MHIAPVSVFCIKFIANFFHKISIKTNTRLTFAANAARSGVLMHFLTKKFTIGKEIFQKAYPFQQQI